MVGKPRLDPAALDSPAQKVIVLVRMLVELAMKGLPDGEEQVLSTITLADCTDREQECLSLFIYDFTLFKQGGASLADDFMKKFQEYDLYIEELGEKLRAALANGEELGAHNKQLREKVRLLAARVEEVECQASATKDELENAMAEKVKALTLQLEKHRAEWERDSKAAHELVEAEKAEQTRLRAQLLEVEATNAALSAELQELHKAGVTRDKLAQLAEEREMLERKLLSLENVLLTEQSERERLAQQLEKVKAKHAREMEEQEGLFGAEIESLRRMLLEAQEAALFADKRSDSTGEGPVSPLELQNGEGSDLQRGSVMSSPRFSSIASPIVMPAPVTISSPITNIINVTTEVANSFSAAVHEHLTFESIQQHFEVIKVSYEQDNEKLRQAVRELREELVAARLKLPEREIPASAVGQSEVLTVRVGGTLTEEMISKLVKLQSSNRNLKSENRNFRQRLEKSETYRHTQLETVYGAALSFMVHGFM